MALVSQEQTKEMEQLPHEITPTIRKGMPHRFIVIVSRGTKCAQQGSATFQSYRPAPQSEWKLT